MRDRGRENHFTVAVSLSLLLAVTAAASVASAELPTPVITGRAAVVLDGTTGRVIWERDADRQLPPASTTKIMTTMLALESGRLDRTFAVSPYAASQAPSKLGLRAGQQMDLEDLAYALMLKSANDAAVVVAEGLAGSVPEFSALMNQRAREIGATNTHFHNPNGLPDDEHLTTPHDMAIILRHALTVPGFREVAGTNAKIIQIEDERIHPVALHSKNRLLNGYFVPVLGKTGYTRAAGRCFAGAAELNGRRVITVVFGASDMWGDTRKLMEYGFSTFDDTAPVVQLALEQSRRYAPPKTVASARSARRRATVVASRSKARSTVRSTRRTTTTVASASRSKSKSKGKTSTAAASLARGKSSAQLASRTQPATVTASAARSATRASATAAKATKPADRQAKLETASSNRRR